MPHLASVHASAAHAATGGPGFPLQVAGGTCRTATGHLLTAPSGDHPLWSGRACAKASLRPREGCSAHASWLKLTHGLQFLPEKSWNPQMRTRFPLAGRASFTGVHVSASPSTDARMVSKFSWIQGEPPRLAPTRASLEHLTQAALTAVVKHICVFRDLVYLGTVPALCVETKK